MHAASTTAQVPGRIREGVGGAETGVETSGMGSCSQAAYDPYIG